MNEPATSAESCPGARSRIHGGEPERLPFWRSLDEAAGSPEFARYLEREFPSQLAVWQDPLARRRFLELMAASLALAGVTACTRNPLEEIVPYVRAPEELVPGVPQYYATAMPWGGYGLGVLVESHMGRPTKVEGNPVHPVTRGGSNIFLQASILSLYDPDRSQTILHRGVIATWDALVADLTRALDPLRERQGSGLRILTETVTSPTLAGQLRQVLEQFPSARWHVHETLGGHAARRGAEMAFGRYVHVDYDLAQARTIVALDADFLANTPASLRYAREFIDGRRVAQNSRGMSRLFVAESTPTITGAMADHRVPLRPSLIEPLARAILRRLRSGSAADADAERDLPADWLTAAVRELAASQGTGIVIPGMGQTPVVHALAHAINDAIGAPGQTVSYLEPVEQRPVAGGEEGAGQSAGLRELVADMEAGEVQMLIILGGNPAYSAPGELNFVSNLAKVLLRIHLSEFYDETSFLCDWHIPQAHYLETWSDVRAWDGTATIMQPLIAPLYEGKSAHELLALLLGQSGRPVYEIVQEHWQQVLGDDFGRQWRKALHDGVIPGTQAQPVEVQLTFKDDVPAEQGSAESSDTSGAAGDELEIELRPDPTVGDGRFANNAWLQELPKPLSKLAWDNVAYVSLATAGRLGLASEDVIEIVVGDRKLQAPVWVMPGQPDDCVSLTFGYGRTHAGRVGNRRGYNAYSILPDGEAWFTRGSVRRTGERYQLVTTQNHHSMEGRDIVRVTTLERYQQNPQHLLDAKHHGEAFPSLYPEYSYEGNAWGMVIDQTACIGCNACVVACQAENNVPVVGKEQVAVGREMHWLRIDRYYHGEPEDPEIYFQPMMCVHCEKAPCEVVCPVAATVHDSEGTSNMIYNRCVGTRYCSNNCPYKVRRFNYLAYSDGTTASLKLLRNPDVTVRSRGVMEKCSYCIQRLNGARIEAKKRGDPLVREGEVQTACQQACPTRAIVFGNLNDREGELRKLKASPLNYGVLAELQTQPRTTYLARVVNPHPDLAPPGAAHPETRIGEKDKAHS